MSNARKTLNQSDNTHTSRNKSSQHNSTSSQLKWSSNCYRKESNARNRSLGAYECLENAWVSSSMRLGVPFIAPRQLGAVGSNLGRLILPSVDWRTGQSGARFPSLNSEADRWQPESRWRTGHVSRADRAADRWPGRPLAHRTVRCTTRQSGEFYPYAVNHLPRAMSSPVNSSPDSPVNHWTVR